MKSYIGCICAISLQSEFSDVSLNYLHHSICSHIDSICVFSPLSEISNVSWNCLHKQKHTHIHCMCRIFLQSEYSNGSSNCLPSTKRNHIGCTDLPFLGSLWYNCLKCQKRKISSPVTQNWLPGLDWIGFTSGYRVATALRIVYWPSLSLLGSMLRGQFGCSS